MCIVYMFIMCVYYSVYIYRVMKNDMSSQGGSFSMANIRKGDQHSSLSICMLKQECTKQVGDDLSRRLHSAATTAIRL